jgi:hypothetical protein
MAFGSNGSLLQKTVTSARHAGYHEPFYALGDALVEGAVSCNGTPVAAHGDFGSLVALKAGLAHQFKGTLIWVRPGTLFRWRHRDLCRSLSGGPLHVPFLGLESCGAGLLALVGPPFGELSLAERLRLSGPIFEISPDFWMMRTDAIECVFELVSEYGERVRELGGAADWAGSLAFAGHILCPDRERHLVSESPDVWQPGGWDGGRGIRSALVGPASLNVWVENGTATGEGLA